MFTVPTCPPHLGIIIEDYQIDDNENIFWKKAETERYHQHFLLIDDWGRVEPSFPQQSHVVCGSTEELKFYEPIEREDEFTLPKYEIYPSKSYAAGVFYVEDLSGVRIEQLPDPIHVGTVDQANAAGGTYEAFVPQRTIEPGEYFHPNKFTQEQLRDAALLGAPGVYLFPFRVQNYRDYCHIAAKGADQHNNNDVQIMRWLFLGDVLNEGVGEIENFLLNPDALPVCQEMFQCNINRVNRHEFLTLDGLTSFFEDVLNSDFVSLEVDNIEWELDESSQLEGEDKFSTLDNDGSIQFVCFDDIDEHPRGSRLYKGTLNLSATFEFDGVTSTEFTCPLTIYNRVTTTLNVESLGETGQEIIDLIVKTYGVIEPLMEDVLSTIADPKVRENTVCREVAKILEEVEDVINTIEPNTIENIGSDNRLYTCNHVQLGNFYQHLTEMHAFISQSSAQSDIEWMLEVNGKSYNPDAIVKYDSVITVSLKATILENTFDFYSAKLLIDNCNDYKVDLTKPVANLSLNINDPSTKEEVIENIKISDNFPATNERLIEHKLSVFPNPVIDNLTVAVTSSSDISKIIVSIYSIDSKLILQKLIPTNGIHSKLTLDCGNLESGTYIIAITNQSGFNSSELFTVK